MQLKIKFYIKEKKNPPTTSQHSLEKSQCRGTRGSCTNKERQRTVQKMAHSCGWDLGCWNSQMRHFVLPHTPPLPWGAHPMRSHPRSAGWQVGAFPSLLPPPLGQPQATDTSVTDTSVTHTESRKPYQTNSSNRGLGICNPYTCRKDPKRPFPLPERNITQTIRGLDASSGGLGPDCCPGSGDQTGFCRTKPWVETTAAGREDLLQARPLHAASILSMYSAARAGFVWNQSLRKKQSFPEAHGTETRVLGRYPSFPGFSRIRYSNTILVLVHSNNR